MGIQDKHGIVLVTALGLFSAYCLYRFYCKAKTRKIPTVWTYVGTLKEIYVYPVKSCAPVTEVKKAECTWLGLKDGWLLDRNLMVVDSNNNFISARTYPQLLLAKPSVKDSLLTLEHPTLVPITVDLAKIRATQKQTNATVWYSSVAVYDCGSEASEWFTRLINKPNYKFRLVFYASETTRKSVDPRNKYFKFIEGDLGAFSDDAAFNLINEASVDDLNLRLEDCQVSTLQFRPNFVLSGGVAYDEDNWSFIKIGQNIFEIVRPCIRCTLTTLDPETGARNTKNEPLQTLKKYRQLDSEEVRKAFGHSPRMGMQIALRTAPGGVVAIGDSIHVA